MLSSSTGTQEFDTGKSNPSSTHMESKCNEACGCARPFQPPWAAGHAGRKQKVTIEDMEGDCEKVGTTSSTYNKSEATSMHMSTGESTLSDYAPVHPVPSADGATRAAVLKDMMPRRQPLMWKEEGKVVDYELRVAEHFRQLPH